MGLGMGLARFEGWQWQKWTHAFGSELLATRPEVRSNVDFGLFLAELRRFWATVAQILEQKCTNDFFDAQIAKGGVPWGWLLTRFLNVLKICIHVHGCLKIGKNCTFGPFSVL